MRAKRRRSVKNRRTAGRFRKGHSGNPRGRPKGALNRATIEAKDFCRALVGHPAYLEKFTRAFLTRRLSWRVEQMVWAYAFGKPTQRVDVGVFDHVAYLAGLDTDPGSANPSRPADANGPGASEGEHAAHLVPAGHVPPQPGASLEHAHAECDVEPGGDPLADILERAATAARRKANRRPNLPYCQPRSETRR